MTMSHGQQRSHTFGAVTRRSFLHTTAVTGGVLLVNAATAFRAHANERLRLGLIGCGGRGPWIADLFEKHTNTKCVAVHDYFYDEVTSVGDRFNVPKERRFIGLDGYHELVHSEVDIVAVQTPSYFHPEQAIAALEAGKPVYMAKPVAADVYGCLRLLEASKKYDGKLSMWVDFQTRANPAYLERVQAVHEGIMGKPICGQAYYHTARIGIRTNPAQKTAHLRNWVFDIQLSGDIIVEQNIHTLDVANWILRQHPVRATGTGGRKVRTDIGDCWDHFVVTYIYPDGFILDFMSTQFTTGYEDICTRIFGEEGTIDCHYFKKVSLETKKQTFPDASTGNIYTDGAVANIKKFHESVVSGTPINNFPSAIESTLTCLLGRTAAYEGRTVTWDDLIAGNQRNTPNLDLPPDGPYEHREPV
jgi:predicted dehydrogenase